MTNHTDSKPFDISKIKLASLDPGAEDQLDRDVQRDAEFVENLCYYDRKCLAQMLCEMAQTDGTRKYIIDSLHVIQEFGYFMNVYYGSIAKMSVMAKISDQVDEIKKEEGPSGLNPQSIPGLADEVAAGGHQAFLKATEQKNTDALNILINTASRAIYGLIYHIQKNPEGVQKNGPSAAESNSNTSAAESRDSGSAAEFEKPETKKADPAATEPAENSSHHKPVSSSAVSGANVDENNQ